jgi:hypothetical protein
MNAIATPGALKKFRRSPWRFQQTVELPAVSDRDRFVSTIIVAIGGLASATLTIDEIFFKTERLTDLCPTGVTLALDTAIMALSAAELSALLKAAFWDGPDFLCIPTPKPFVFHADHDNWITFYANSKSNLSLIVEPMTCNGYKIIHDWRRKL